MFKKKHVACISEKSQLGKELIHVLRHEARQSKEQLSGTYLLRGLSKLQDQFPEILCWSHRQACILKSEANATARV